jgi:hypothetical protein
MLLMTVTAAWENIGTVVSFQSEQKNKKSVGNVPYAS